MCWKKQRSSNTSTSGSQRFRTVFRSQTCVTKSSASVLSVSRCCLFLVCPRNKHKCFITKWAQHSAWRWLWVRQLSSEIGILEQVKFRIHMLGISHGNTVSAWECILCNWVIWPTFYRMLCSSMKKVLDNALMIQKRSGRQESGSRQAFQYMLCAYFGQFTNCFGLIFSDLMIAKAWWFQFVRLRTTHVRQLTICPRMFLRVLSCQTSKKQLP